MMLLFTCGSIALGTRCAESTFLRLVNVDFVVVDEMFVSLTNFLVALCILQLLK